MMAAYFGVSLFVTSTLLFCVQPLCGKMLLPSLGGSPAVWNTCVLFFQAALLAGYAYVHAATRSPRVHSIVHLLLLVLAAYFLPMRMVLDNPSASQPVLWLLLVLTAGVGLPFFVLSASAPLLQQWFSRTHHPSARNPYFLYAASNLGSLFALLVYPLLIEPKLTLEQQNHLWKWCYVAAALLLLGCAAIMWFSPTRSVSEGNSTLARSASEAESHTHPVESPLHWLLLAMVPSSLMLSTTTYITTDIAPMPLLWVIPLALYLLTFVLAFSRSGLVQTRFFSRWTPLLALVLILTMLLEVQQPILVIVALHLLGLFWLAMLCHGELARLRPPASRLTVYYLCIATGGLLGGVFNALAAPLIFQRTVEYPLMIVAASLLRPAAEKLTMLSLRRDAAFAVSLGVLTAGLVWMVQSLQWLPPGQLSVAILFAPMLIIAYLTHDRPIRFALGIGSVLLASVLYHGRHGQEVHVQRSFFGVHRVTQDDRFRYLIHGATQHGQQSLDPAERRTPLMYYHPGGPIGELIGMLHGDSRLEHVGLVGLGCGALAAYAESGQHWTFCEIDPAVIYIARDSGLFTYLRDCRGKCDVQLGDGRLLLRKSSQEFGLLVIDAFSSDSIPVHLLTREAFALYRGRLANNGVLALHISNNYLDLEPVLAALAKGAGAEWHCLIRRDTVVDEYEKQRGKAASEWVVITKDSQLAQRLLREAWQPAVIDPATPVWTDDYSNLLQIFRW